MKLSIPELALVVLIGPSGSGKSTFAKKHFEPFEVISSDLCRGMVGNDENDQSVTTEAFELLHYILHKRLALGRLTVVDATNVKAEDRKPLVAAARDHHVLPVAIVFDVAESVCRERNRTRPDRQFGGHVIRQHRQAMRRSLRGLSREGFRHVYKLQTQDQVDEAVIERRPLWNNLRHEHGPFDIIGDVHGCFDELCRLLEALGYRTDRRDDSEGNPTFAVTAPEGRKAIFVGDIVDRGPDVPSTLRLVMSMVDAGTALCLPGNHEMKLVRKLRGRDVQLTHGLAASVEQLSREDERFRERAVAFLDALVSHYVLDDGRLVVAHAGMRQELQGRASGYVRQFALYGETTGETDEFGLPVRYNWAAEYRGPATVVYGHTPVPEAEWLNRTINIDTGCVFGGALTALRYPEKELVSVPAARTYAEPARPLAADEQATALSAQQQYDDILDLADVIGKRIIRTRLGRSVTIGPQHAAAALEVMSRFATNPKWLIYLPPTMSPPETSQRAGLLEHPEEAFAYYRRRGIGTVICEEKHMGSRAVVIVCRDDTAVRRRFGIEHADMGACYTRTGRSFFADDDLQSEVLERVHDAATRAGLWAELETDWLCLDCELMPWSAKAQELLRQQYAAVGAAATHSLRHALEVLSVFDGDDGDGAELLRRYERRAEAIERYIEAYGRYCWFVGSVADLRLAPFHVLATEGKVHVDRDHAWHMFVAAKLAATDDPVLMETAHRTVNLLDESSVAEGIAWWEDLTARGSEGMVVKPLQFAAKGRRGLVQPALKCRGREYLRIIYGPEYTADEHLERLRKRGLSTKRSLAMQEFCLGIEALERFVRGEPLRRVHECVFGVLALESEPVDPRL
jgi:protein phosphatase